MTKIDEVYLEKLRSAGLHSSPPVPSFRDGVWVGKPTSTVGNHIPGYTDGGYTIFGEDAPPDMDAPMLKFYIDSENNWMVRGEDYAGAKGPGDFVHLWKTPEEALDDILDFYFGNPARMQEKSEGFQRSVSYD